MSMLSTAPETKPNNSTGEHCCSPYSCTIQSHMIMSTKQLLLYTLTNIPNPEPHNNLNGKPQDMCAKLPVRNPKNSSTLKPSPHGPKPKP